MLRMGRGPKTEPAKDERQPLPNNAAQANPPTPPQQTFARPPATPAPASSPPQPATTPQAERPAPARALTESDALARDIKEGIVGGFVGKNADLTGEANFKGMLRIDGRFSGTINSEDGTLIVSAGGIVEANVEVATARINGTVNGDIKATRRVEFGRSAQVRGDIQTPSLVIEDGAIFEGSCRMSTAAAPSKVEATVEAKARPARQNGGAQTMPLPPVEGAEPSSTSASKTAV
ncbi:MAG TPA: polymer-forming cytoskeletal protein [Pyrinomonadaceae bacterium]|nr:polymer-forming cytoskeletal protein [Pyrinomonadaceae bacterium]